MNYNIKYNNNIIAEIKENDTRPITLLTADKYCIDDITIEPFTEPTKEYLTFTAEEAESTIGLDHKNSTAELKYSFDKVSWIELNERDTITLNNIGDKVYFRGSSTNGSNDNRTRFMMTGKIAASGSIMSILCDDPDATELPHDYCCYDMFSGCDSLTLAPELPAIVLAKSCYRTMFYNCTSLTQAPELPATILAENCYDYMFYRCTSLTQAPELPAMILASRCYFGMFCACTSLAQAPELSATTLESQCYQDMFDYCTSLTRPLELPATSLTQECYSHMFNDCTSIKLSETQTDKYQIPYRIPSNGTGIDAEDSLYRMFQGTGGTFKGTPNINQTYYLWDPGYIPPIDVLTFTAEEAGSTFGLLTKYSTAELKYSFDKTNWIELNVGNTVTLTSVGDKAYLRGRSSPGIIGSTPTQFTMTGKIAASGSIMSILCDDPESTELPHEYCCGGMFSGCTALTSAPMLPALTLKVRCYSLMFEDCVSLIEAPQLPATILYGQDYEAMFEDCISLTRPPELPATAISASSYQSMFFNCSSLKVSAIQTGNYQIPYRIPSTGTGTTSYNSLFQMFYGTGGTFTGTPNINQTYYLWDENIVSIPTINNTTYNGSTQTPNISPYDSNIIDLSGDLQGKNAGTYTITFSLKNPLKYHWTDGTVEDKQQNWTINKANCSITTMPSCPTSIPLNGRTAVTVGTPGSANGGGIKYGINNSVTAPSSWLDNMPTVSSIGSYNIWYKVVGDANHNDITPTLFATVSVISEQRVGGRIYYDNGYNGATYQFFDINGNLIANQTISGLTNAYYYNIIGTPPQDRWFVYDNTSHNFGEVEVINGLTINSLIWGQYNIVTGATADGMGAGASNTTRAMLVMTDNNNIFKYVSNCNTEKLNGCNDWFIPSMAEVSALHDSGLTSWWTDSYLLHIFSSNQASATHAYSSTGRDHPLSWTTGSKSFPQQAFAARSF